MKIARIVSVAVILLLLLGGGLHVLTGKKEPIEPVAIGKEAAAGIVVYTTLSSALIAPLALEYERNYAIPLQIRQMTENELKEALAAQKLEKGALLIADAGFLETQKGFFTPLVSEQGDMLLDQFRESDGLWTGLWFDPVVFAVNRESLLPKPEQWDELERKDATFRLGIADFLLSDNMALPFYYTVAQQGEERALEYWLRIHPRVTQYAKFPSTPVRMVGLGEADLAVVMQSEALRYLQDGFPINIIYPQPSTPYMLLGVGILQDPDELHRKKAASFIEWLMLDTPQYLLEQNRTFWISVHPDTLQYRRYASRIDLAEIKMPELETKKRLLDNWVRKVRLGNK
ncbi:ABC transporter substrate-binding protein [Azotosporobacter soli]|uniref:ABC transporter substrate-binding protein n=1 Tax=Azotosporobacter soli TaxID=3055040 RepID=UPI0031FF21C3